MVGSDVFFLFGFRPIFRGRVVIFRECMYCFSQRKIRSAHRNTNLALGKGADKVR